MTITEGVKQEVWHEVKRMVKPGNVISKRSWKIAYEMVRARAIAETVMWKNKYITIEEVDYDD